MFVFRSEEICVELDTGNRHTWAHRSYLQGAPRARRVRRGVALVHLRERAARRTVAPCLTRDYQFHRGLAELCREVVPFDPVQHWRRRD